MTKRVIAGSTEAKALLFLAIHGGQTGAAVKVHIKLPPNHRDLTARLKHKDLIACAGTGRGAVWHCTCAGLIEAERIQPFADGEIDLGRVA